MKHVKSLDGVRAVAILAVVSSHVLPTRGAGGGWIGVEIFFVLSGYLITSILTNEWDKTGTVSFRRFYIRRALRLYPALITMFAIGAFFVPLFGDNGTWMGYALTVVINGAYLTDLTVAFFHNPFGGFGQTWSLAIEEHFYLIWPLTLVFFLKRRVDPRWVVGCGIAVSLTLLATTMHRPMGDVPTAYYAPQTQACAPLIGCLLALTLRSRGGTHRRTTSLLANASAFGLLGVFIVSGLPAAPRSKYLFPELVAACLFSSALIAGLIAVPSSSSSRMLGLPVMRWIGKISYGWYLYHLSFVLVLDHYMTGSRALMYAVAVPASLFAAALSYRFIERPFLRRKPPLMDPATTLIPVALVIDR